LGIKVYMKLVMIIFATSKNHRVKSMFQHCNIHKYTRAFPDGKTYNQIDHILVDRQRHSNVLDVRSFREADCDTDHYLVVAKVRERLVVNKQRSHRFHMERFNLKKLNEVQGKEKYRTEVSNRFAALEDLDAEVEINSAWETIRENIRISAKEILGYYELKKHKPWFNEGSSKLLDQRIQAKLQWLQDPSGTNLVPVILKLKKYKLPGSDEIPTKLIQAGGEILLSAIHKLVNSVWNKEKLPDQ
jgi:hypothetical protein